MELGRTQQEIIADYVDQGFAVAQIAKVLGHTTSYIHDQLVDLNKKIDYRRRLQEKIHDLEALKNRIIHQELEIMEKGRLVESSSDGVSSGPMGGPIRTDTKTVGIREYSVVALQRNLLAAIKNQHALEEVLYRLPDFTEREPIKFILLEPAKDRKLPGGYGGTIDSSQPDRIEGEE